MIEAALTGRLGGDIEVMTSRSGKPFAASRSQSALVTLRGGLLR
jgi:hypothetical protein